jgi:hypothetical protein
MSSAIGDSHCERSEQRGADPRVGWCGEGFSREADPYPDHLLILFLDRQ